MIDNYASQCGYCTPGFVNSLGDLFENEDRIDRQRIKNYCTGNLCRCTGYEPIIEAALAIEPATVGKLRQRYHSELVNKDLLQVLSQPLELQSDSKHLFMPTTLDQALEWKKNHPQARIWGAATDIGVQLNKGNTKLETAMSLAMVAHLSEITMSPDRVDVGARHLRHGHQVRRVHARHPLPPRGPRRL